MHIITAIEACHSIHRSAVVLRSDEAASLRQFIAGAGGGDVVEVPAGAESPTFTGAAVHLSGGERVEVEGAPLLGIWAGAPLISDVVASACRSGRV